MSLKSLQLDSEYEDDGHKFYEATITVIIDKIEYELEITVELGDNVGGWQGAILITESNIQPPIKSNEEDDSFWLWIQAFPDAEILAKLGLTNYEACDSYASEGEWYTYIKKKDAK